MADNNLLLIDAHGVIYRAYYAFPELSTSNGLLVNAVYGFARIVLTTLSEREPQYVVVAFDHKDKTKRHSTYDAYKANRAAMPDDLKPQIAIVKDFVQAMNIPHFELSGYEADDLIGTIVTDVEKKEPDLENLIVTGDKDLLQLVNEKTHVLIPSRVRGQEDAEYDSAGVAAKLGIAPNQVVELKALMGDSSDNIPGVKGIGQKTAVALLHQFGTISALYAALETDAEKTGLAQGVLNKLLAGKQDAFLSQGLATIDCAAPIDFELDHCKLTAYDKDEVEAFLEKYEFESLMKLLPKDDFELGVQDALF